MAQHKNIVKTQLWHIEYVCDGKLLKEVQNALIVLARMQNNVIMYRKLSTSKLFK
jgi:hypothetical protein